jgi:uncharacterized membrane protein YgaE (UPF0421/DUF939 family)
MTSPLSTNPLPLPVHEDSTPRSHRAAARAAVRRMLRPSRLILAGKTALAGTIAWYIGHMLPGEMADFAYYAPLGALISMAPTLMDSLRSSLQTVAGLALGIGVAWGLIVSGAPAWAVVPIALAVGTVLAGLPILGPGRDYVPIAALFVLIIGGANANDFSVGYLVQMGVGMAIGIVVNLLIAPPLPTDDAASVISSLRRAGARTLEAMSDALRSGDRESSWAEDLASFETRLSEAATAVRNAREGSRANPRVRWSHYDVDEDLEDIAALRRTRVHLAAIGSILRGSELEKPLAEVVDHEGRDVAARLLSAIARSVERWNDERGGSPAEERTGEVAELERALRLHAAPPEAQPLVSALAVAAGRLSEEIADRSGSRQV